MKYPQLVSTRAVNAISDWLVSRLEQLGVEAPQIYTRLLLSLLQSSVQINDPIEFNSLETFIGNRKGGSIKRYHLPCDANSLKKLNAVQCLSEIVSSEQELTAIESLVDELWEKLNDIEKQLEYSNGDEIILVNNLMSSTACVDKSKVNTNNDQTIETSHTNLSKNCKKNYNNEKRTIICRGRRDIEKSIELETDPKKRYFNAFPALSKEMEDSFRIWHRNSKSLTWPADRANIIAKNTSLNLPNSLPTSCEIKSSKSTKNDDLNVSKLEHLSNSTNHAIISSSTGGGGGLKRRTRRRKSQSMSKGRAMPNTRKTALNDNVINVMSTTGNSGGHRRSNRHMSPTQWDTDFEGYWEMGRDLIKEFFAKQSDKNQNQNQNRCNSANGVCSMNKTEDAAKEMETQSIVETEKLASSSPLMPPVDISFCCDDSIDDDDTYKSIVELTADNSNNKPRSSPRRLYQRLALPDSPIDGDSEISTSKNEVQADIMQLKAKFNSNIASLWQNNSDDENTINNDDESSLWSAPSNLQWPHVAPIKENLKNFWTNFYNQQFELPNSQTEQQQDQQINLENYPDVVDMNGCSSLPYKMASMPNVTAKPIGNNDFHSMPFNLEGLDMTDGGGSAGVTGRNKIYKKLDGRRTPVGVFLQDSIWSENLNGGKNTDTDESFYLKVWNSNRKLHNLDAIYEKKIPEGTNETKINAPSFQFSSYGNSRWSEGINAEPNILQIQRKQQQKNDQLPLLNTCNTNETLNQSIDCIDASISATTTSSSSCSSSAAHTLSSSGIFSGQTPSMQSSNIQLIDNAKSLSEVYDDIDNSPINDDCQLDAVIENNEKKMSPVSLSNHSNESSGFIEYSRIKSFSQAAALKQQCNYQRSNDQHYPDDPNENLLTAERTHFQPIRAYADGYTFDVCSALEVIEYKRSESGYLYFESEKYLEYTRKDTFMAEEENTGTAVVVVASAAPLYAGSNCEAAISQKRKRENNTRTEQLVLKFRIRNQEIACQTEDEATVSSMYAELEQQEQQPHPLYLIFSSNVSKGLKIPTTGQAAKSAAAAASEQEQERIQLDTPWLRLDELIATSRNTINHDSSMIWTALQDTTPLRRGGDEITGIDEIDFCNESSCIYGNSMDQQQWSSLRRNSIEKNCQLNGRGGGGGAGAGAVACCPAESHLGKNNSENNNLISMQQNNAEMHSLWGMCAVCNNYKSAPANHLLRDELKIEADEIMSDLKNMQDLYIGGQQDTDTDDIDSYCSGDYFWGRHGPTPRNLPHPYPITMKASYEKCDDGDGDLNIRKTNDWRDDNDLMEMRQKETQQKVIQQVNKLIADLMRPEKANDTNVLADAAASAHRELGESFWPDDGGEHNIWKQHNDSCSRNSSNRYDDGENQSVRPSRYSILCDEEKKFLAQLTWEHDNLAEIWTKSTPPLKTTKPKQSLPSTPPLKPPSSPVLLCSSSASSADACAKKCLADNSDVPSSSPITSTNIVETHELIKPIDESIESSNNRSVTASNINYKRIQQFLNSTGASNASKLKLSNRKRRHSASQNYAILYNNGLMNGTNHKTNNSNNNNNTKVSDLNNYNFKRNANNKTINNKTDDEKSNDAALTVTENYTEDIDMMIDDGLNDTDAYFLIKNNGDMNMILPPPKQTIITCQYWTTIDPIMDTDVNDDGTSFSCLVDKNNTILKHVTMLARPLTR